MHGAGEELLDRALRSVRPCEFAADTDTLAGDRVETTSGMFIDILFFPKKKPSEANAKEGQRFAVIL